jgi:hypothetical protein
MNVGIDIYTMTVIIIALILIAVIVLYALINKKSVKVSKNGLQITTQSSTFLSKEAILYMLERRDDLLNAENRIKIHDIVHEQMNYIERAVDIFYNQLISRINEEIKKEDCPIINNWEMMLKLQKNEFLLFFKNDIVKKNHFLHKNDWENYKRETFEYTLTKALSQIDGIFSDFNIEKRGEIIAYWLDIVRSEYGKHFYKWLDELKKITAEKTDQLEKIKKEKEKLFQNLDAKGDE